MVYRYTRDLINGQSIYDLQEDWDICGVSIGGIPISFSMGYRKEKGKLIDTIMLNDRPTRTLSEALEIDVIHRKK